MNYDNIIRRLTSEIDYFYNDYPYIFKNLIENPSELVSWKTIEDCMNRPEHFKMELINKKDSNKISIPEYEKSWSQLNRNIQDKKFIFDEFADGNSLIILNYGYYNKITSEFLKMFEDTFDVNADIHVYCGLENSSSFKIHCDNPANYICQIEGETEWTVFKNKMSVFCDVGEANKNVDTCPTIFKKEFSTILKPGDVLYIPPKQYHLAEPTGKRLSLSVPCWPKGANSSFINNDRNYYTIAV
jgi:hypothetical protein